MWAGRRRTLARTLPFSLLAVTLIAALDEFNQRRIPGRTANPEDVLVDIRRLHRFSRLCRHPLSL
ncbi:VanZ family protein [Paenibacillus sacheonensis]|uniref:VanZ family protein n=1 Tax=Paenibacillus sacheonensis TaxID=742054 RepID=UPI0014796E0D